MNNDSANLKFANKKAVKLVTLASLINAVDLVAVFLSMSLSSFTELSNFSQRLTTTAQSALGDI